MTEASFPKAPNFQDFCAGLSNPLEYLNLRLLTQGISMSDLKKKFAKASEDVKKAKKDPGNDMKLKLYAHFKQASDGDVSGDKPGFTDFVNRAKYDAWAKLKGMSQDDAMTAYVKLVERVLRDQE
jgi:diazepam-binding inhibitor (GABA receptor modulator, acyl-CoA-binding protein)